MKYFTLTLKRPTGEPFFVTDLPPLSFDLPVQYLVSALLQRGLFYQGEKYRALITARQTQIPTSTSRRF
ncbi:MAG: hypothetical protein IPK17_17535 [Chloroflexi bacterium]|uniref:hypothetical protein n=1 Tax=Candidatus Flexifilum breve TaxID=3140694 RepID=UPI00313507C4|nr:hypothetical protein [Chloroflexota bacterium]